MGGRERHLSLLVPAPIPTRRPTDSPHPTVGIFHGRCTVEVGSGAPIDRSIRHGRAGARTENGKLAPTTTAAASNGEGKGTRPEAAACTRRDRSTGSRGSKRRGAAAWGGWDGAAAAGLEFLVRAPCRCGCRCGVCYFFFAPSNQRSSTAAPAGPTHRWPGAPQRFEGGGSGSIGFCGGSGGGRAQGAAGPLPFWLGRVDSAAL